MGIHRSLVDSLHKGQWRGALMFSLICDWASNRDAGDLRRHRAHYDVALMWGEQAASQSDLMRGWYAQGTGPGYRHSSVRMSGAWAGSYRWMTFYTCRYSIDISLGTEQLSCGVIRVVMIYNVTVAMIKLTLNTLLCAVDLQRIWKDWIIHRQVSSKQLIILKLAAISGVPCVSWHPPCPLMMWRPLGN